MKAEWKKVCLDEMGTISRGRSKHRPRNDSSLFNGKYPFIQTADVKNANLYITEYSQTYNEKGLAQSKLWNKGTLCITIAANIADTAILGIDACFPDSIMGFIPNTEISDVKYVKYCFDILQKECQSISVGAAQDNLSWEKLSRIKFPCPPIATQQKIASILSAYDDLIENNRKQIKLLEEAAQRLYKEWFVDLRFPGYENVAIVDDLPEGWRIGTLGDLGNIITGKTPSKKNERYYGSAIPFVKIPDMHDCIYPITTEECLSLEGANSQKNKFIPPESLIVSCIGTAGLVNIAFELCQTNQQINSIICNNNDTLYYLYFFIKSKREYLNALGSNGATMVNVNKEKFGRIEILIPSEFVIEKFKYVVKPYFEKIKSLQQQIQLLQQARDKLLPRLMSGEMEV